MIRLDALHVYPVKSLGGIALAQAELVRTGLAYDRCWMLVDVDGRFVTQRECARLALVKTALTDGVLGLHCAGTSLQVPAPPPDAPRVRTQVWRAAVEGIDCGDTAAQWLQTHLGIAVRLIRMPEDFHRPVDPVYALHGETTAYADGFPLLLISEASLQNFNTRLHRPVPMNRFRPNLVVSGCAPWAEDNWKRIRIAGIEFDVTKPCARCAIPSIDQDTALSCLCAAILHCHVHIWYFSDRK